MKEVVLRIPDEIHEILGARRDLSKEVLKRLAAFLYAERKISLSKAVELSGIDHGRFMDLLADLGGYLDYDEQDLTEDVETLRRLSFQEKSTQSCC